VVVFRVWVLLGARRQQGGSRVVEGSEHRRLLVAHDLLDDVDRYSRRLRDETGVSPFRAEAINRVASRTLNAVR
jgi:hypothetical protein